MTSLRKLQKRLWRKMPDNGLSQRGWLQLPVRLKVDELDSLWDHLSVNGAGHRIKNPEALSLPTSLKDALTHFRYEPVVRRAVAFDKSSDANWSLPWHQDRVIVRANRTNDPTLTNWTRKDGLWHCEPEEAVLRRIAFAYIALDAVARGSGGLELAEQTHRFGRIEAADIEARVSDANLVAPGLEPDDVLLVEALTLHRSQLLSGTSRRRALRLDLFKLPEYRLSPVD